MKKNNNLKQPILITGATGFIGANLVRYFVSKNIKVNIILKKNSNIWRIKNIINKTNFYYVDLNDEKNACNKLITPLNSTIHEFIRTFCRWKTNFRLI